MLVQRGLMLPVGMEQLVVRSAVRRRDFDTLVGCMVLFVVIIDTGIILSSQSCKRMSKQIEIH